MQPYFQHEYLFNTDDKHSAKHSGLSSHPTERLDFLASALIIFGPYAPAFPDPRDGYFGASWKYIFFLSVNIIDGSRARKPPLFCFVLSALAVFQDTL